MLVIAIAPYFDFRELMDNGVRVFIIRAPPAGLEPAIFGLEVRRLVH